MKQSKIKIIAAAFALALGGLSLNAQAEVFDPEANAENSNGRSCNYFGHVIRVSAYDAQSHSYVYWRKSALDNRNYYAKIDDSQLLNAAMHAMNGPVKVRIRTDEHCNDHRFKGFVTRIQLNP